MSVFALIPDVKYAFLTNTGSPANGGLLFVYTAGTTTKATTYTDSTGASNNTNPIVLNSRGEVPNGVYVAAGTYKLVFAPSTDTDPPSSPYWTRDNITPVNNVSGATFSEWLSSGLTPTYISGTSFSVPGDQTLTIPAGRRLKTTNTGGTIYSTVSTSTFGAGVTTLVVVNDSGTLDSGLSALSYGILNTLNVSIPSVPILPGYNVFRQILAAGTKFGPSSAGGTYFNLSVPGGLLGSTRCFVVEAWGQFFNNSGGGANFDIGMTYGGQTLFDTGVVSWATSGNARCWRMRTLIQPRSGTGNQTSSTTFAMTPGIVASGGMSSTPDSVFGASNAGLTVDSTAAQLMTLTCSQTNNAQVYSQLDGALCYLL